jgi:diguanylate cyclase (GGDEF)-like protein
MNSIVPTKQFLKIANELYILQSANAKRYRELAVSMIAANSEIVLIGMPSPMQIEVVLAAAKRAEPTLRLSYLVIPGLHLEIVELMTRMRQLAPEMVVVTDIKNLHFFDLEHLQTSIYRIGENQNQLTLANGRLLQFIPSPYILSAGSFITYDITSQTLFSNHLFANPAATDSTPIDYQHQSLKYLSARLPSSDYVRLTTKKIQPLAIQRIVTAYGNVLEEFQAKANIESTNAFDFYNLGSSLNRAPSGPVDYLAFANQVVRKLRSIFGADALISLFENTEIHYDPVADEIKSNGKESFRIWHRLFDLIFVKQGVTWLAIVEPIIDKLEEMYEVKKPSIYQSILIDNSKQIHLLDAEKEALQNKVSLLEKEKQITLDRLVKDPLTGFFNELYMHSHLEARIDDLKQKEDAPLFSLIYVAIDMLFRINRKYSYEIGDETIKHFAQLLEDLIPDVDRLFKASGSAIAILTNRTVDRVELDNILTKVRESTSFIEPITASLALVRSNEFGFEDDTKAVVDRLVTAAENRIQNAYQKGGNMIIDGDTIIRKPKRGKVLIVEDDEIHANFMRNALQNESFDTDRAKDGLEALNRINETLYSAIICDKFVPKMDGFALKTAINKTTHQMTCFLLLTHAKTTETIARANKLGITAVIQKPILIEEIVGFIVRNQTLRG